MTAPLAAAIDTDNVRTVLRVLADQVCAGKPRAQRQADELVPLLCQPPTSLALFSDLCAAVGRGDEVGARRLLDALCVSEQVA